MSGAAQGFNYRYYIDFFRHVVKQEKKVKVKCIYKPDFSIPEAKRNTRECIVDQKCEETL